MKISDALRFGGLADAELVAGEDGISREILSVSVLEVAESAISDWVVEGQLYITAFYAIRDNVEMQKVVIESLEQSGCCGLVLCHVGRVLPAIDPAIVDLCDELDFPLLKANPDVSYVEILNPILERLNKGRESDATLGVRIPDSAGDVDAQALAGQGAGLINMLLDEREIPDILRSIVYPLEHEVSLFDAGDNCLYSNKSDEERESEVEFLRAAHDWEHGGDCDWTDADAFADRVVAIEGTDKLLYHIKAKGHCFGTMLLNFCPGETQRDLSALAARIDLPCALLFSRRQRMRNIESGQTSEFFTNLLIWNFRSRDVAVSAGRSLGFDFARIHHLLVINLNRFQIENDEEKAEQLTRYCKRWFLPAIVRLARAYGDESIVHFRSDTVLVFLADERRPRALSELADALAALFAGGDVTTVSIGVGNRFADIEEIPRAYEEAFNAAIIGRRFCGEGEVVRYDEVWAFHYIAQVRGKQAVRAQAAAVLEPLRRHDERNGTQLIETLKAVFECQMDYTAASRRLFVHRNTLLYRKNQIVQLLGYNPFEMPYLVNVALALWAAE